MTKVSKLKNPWFQHDLFPLGDKKIIKLIDIMGNEGYGLFWRIVEFMHKNELNAGEENLIAGKENAAKIQTEYSVILKNRKKKAKSQEKQ